MHTAMMMEAVCTSETSVNFNLTTWRYIPEDSKFLSFVVHKVLSHSFEKEKDKKINKNPWRYRL
jgi:hypothetical protein